MKQKIILIILAVIVGLIITFLGQPKASHSEQLSEVSQKTIYVDKTIKPSQIIWLAKLMKCESGINASAINPKDLDNTPSNGILQFKVGTFNHYAKKYAIEGEMMNPESQVAIVVYWLLNPGEVVWGNQFPACVRLLGEPPL